MDFAGFRAHIRPSGSIKRVSSSDLVSANPVLALPADRDAGRQPGCHPPRCPPLLAQFGTATAGSDTTTWLTAWAAGGSLFSTSAASGSLYSAHGGMSPCHPVALQQQQQQLEQSIGFGTAYPSAGGERRTLLLNEWVIRTVDRLTSVLPRRTKDCRVRIGDKHAMFLEASRGVTSGWWMDRREQAKPGGEPK